MKVLYRIKRYNPETDTKPRYVEYELEQEPLDRVLDGLNYIKWYLDAIGLEFEPTVRAVNAMQRVYGR